jgi:hypothetical protein
MRSSAIAYCAQKPINFRDRQQSASEDAAKIALI